MAVAIAAAHKVAARSLRKNEGVKKQDIKPASIKAEEEKNSLKDVVTKTDPVTSSTAKTSSQKRSTRSSTSTATVAKADSTEESSEKDTANTYPSTSIKQEHKKDDLQALPIDSKQHLAPQPSTSKSEERSCDTRQSMKDLQVSSDSKDSQSSTPPRRRESTRTRKPSSRLLPSPSPPPPRSSNYYNYLKNTSQTPNNNTSSNSAKGNITGSGNKKASMSSSNTPSSDRIDVVATGLPAMGDSSVDSAMTELSSGPGKRKRRPSTMTRPPSTITKGQEVDDEKIKARASTKSASPDDKENDRHHHVQPKSKSTQKKSKSESGQTQKTKSSRPSTSSVLQNDETEIIKPLLQSDISISHDAYDSDGGFGSVANVSNPLKVSRKSIPKAHTRNEGGEMAADLMRAYSATSTAGSEPPPLILRRGGLKGSIADHRQTSKLSNNGYHQTSSTLQKRSWDRSGVNVPYLRFKLDNLPCKVEDEESSAAEEEDDFHVAMLNNDNFDAMSDIDEDVPRREFKSQDNSDIDDTPATTPQSPRSTCDGHEKEEPKGRSRTTTRDAVFAHALEPSASRPHTHAGALTLSLPYEEMPQPNDDLTRLVKVEEMEANPSITVDSEAREEGDAGGVASDLLGSNNAGLDHVQRQMLSSPNPGSAFVSPLMSNVQLIKNEPTPLALPPSYADGSRNGKMTNSKLNKTTRFDSAGSSDTDEEDGEEENGYNQVPMAFGPPESICLSELDRAWEQGEYLLRARKLALDPIRADEESSKTPKKETSNVKRPSDASEEKEEDEGHRKRTRTPVKQIKSAPKVSPATTRLSRRNTRRSNGISS